MEAFFFGQAPVQLLGVYHAPPPAQDRLQGAVLCYPFGQEYMRAHRAFRLLAESLAAKGYHVLRFDYRGSGDSTGDLDRVTAGDWMADIGTAVQELRDMSGIHAVTLVGLRLGALLAAVHAASRDDISGLVLWDPVVEGRAYVGGLEAQINETSGDKRLSNFADADGGIHFNGFTMPRTFKDSLRPLTLLSQRPDCARILQLVSHHNAQFKALREAWSTLDNYHFEYRPTEHDWNYIDHIGGILLPRQALQGIREWF